MAKKIGISAGMLNNISKSVKKIDEIDTKANYKIEYIALKDLVPNPKNFYELVNIEELAEDIKLNGLNSNLLVRPIGDEGKYELIGGHRRYSALSKLVSEGEKKFKIVPCQVRKLNDIDTEIALINDNAQNRELTEAEKLKQVERLTVLYKEKKAKGEAVPGRIRERIAGDLGLSSTQVGRYEKINRGLIPELKELIESQKLSISNGESFAALTEESQKELVDIVKSKDIELTKKDGEELKKKMKAMEAAQKEKEEEMQKRIDSMKAEFEKQVVEKDNEIRSLSDDKEKEKESRQALEVERQELEAKLRAEEARVQAEIEKAIKEETEKIKKELKDSKSKVKSKKKKLNDSEEDSEEYKVIRANEEVITKVKSIMGKIDPTLGTIKKLQNEDIEITEETMEVVNKLIDIVENFTVSIKEILKK
ncbi:ParB N-terminal domain-containing protein [Clostridium bornimense]|uniref:ParB/RepB/Spo0J family partition protein n=1 Tax=Clostridium bornimense TaxID=1216932 RepID=UPI001C11312D|nr:ParB N-terminal domain-containing protein [Clostridium bornimense]MBU5317641.1 ParB N-terminal domain-containing protein [Clostridium bornimense]